ncbi:MAG: glycoside hydrolase family 5 protein [Crenarchaeota archaeon]|nr:glycoside hydrolase family 5 protein [Thermoproteota archaeon]
MLRVLVLMILFILSYNSIWMKCFPENSEAKFCWLKACGRWIVDQNGNIVLLRGVNYAGMEFGWFHHSEEDFIRIKNWGFNVVRLPIAWSYIEPREGFYDDTYLAIVDKVVSWCEKNSLYVILDMHQWNWALKFGGNGFPNWTVEQYSTQDEAKIGFFKNETLQDRFFKMWRHVASRYRENPVIFAYDIFNEPNVYYGLMSEASFLEVLQSFYQHAVDHIREVDLKHCVMIEPPWGAGVKQWKKINDDNLVLSTHLYTGGTWDGKTGYKGDPSILETDFLTGYNLSLTWNVPLFIGEFGVSSAAPKAHEWVRDFMSIFDKYIVGSCLWSYWRDDSMGLLTTRGEEKENLLSALVRIYPCRFKHVPTSFSYDIYTKHARAEWLLNENNISIIFKIPSKLGCNFSVSLGFKSAFFFFDKDTSELKAVLQGPGGGYLEIFAQKQLEEKGVEEGSKSITQNLYFQISLIVNILLLLVVILLHRKYLVRVLQLKLRILNT